MNSRNCPSTLTHLVDLKEDEHRDDVHERRVELEVDLGGADVVAAAEHALHAEGAAQRVEDAELLRDAPLQRLATVEEQVLGGGVGAAAVAVVAAVVAAAAAAAVAEEVEPVGGGGRLALLRYKQLVTVLPEDQICQKKSWLVCS